MKQRAEALVKCFKAGKFSYEEIAEYSDLTVDEVKELATKQPA